MATTAPPRPPLLPKRFELSPDGDGGSSTSAVSGQTDQCTGPAVPTRRRGRRVLSDQALYLPLLRRRHPLLQRRFACQNAYCTVPLTPSRNGVRPELMTPHD